MQYVVIHTTEGSEGPNAAENGAAYDKVRTDGTSTHLFVDSNSAVQEVRFVDRAHAARFHGNEIGIQIELCGYAGQTWAQWHDAASTTELRIASQEVAAICREYNLPVVHLTVAQVRAAYYGPVRPKGICSHYDVTRAYPEDGGTHTDPGPSYPWDEFLGMVRAELNGSGDDDMQFFQAEDDAAGRMNGCTYEFAPDYPTLLRWQAKYPAAPRLRVTRADLASGVYGLNMSTLVNPAPVPIPPGGGVSEAQAHLIAREEIGRAQITPGQ